MLITKQAPALMTITDTCRVIGFSRSSFYRAAAAGRIAIVRAEGPSSRSQRPATEPRR
jgi:hypothetical protein